MATYVDSSMLEHQASQAEIHDMMLQKAHDLFALCDKENKGFITKRDMQRLQTELPLTPQQLEDVFDSLDEDGNGYLTREEFTEGFGGFVGIGSTSVEKQHSIDSSSSTGTEHVYENERGADEEYEEHFQQVMDSIGVHTVIDDTETLKSLWSHLRSEDPELLGPFERFLARVTSELKRIHQEHQSLESALRSKTASYEDEVKKLYEEMEQQIRLEKERILAEERAREVQVREEMEKLLREKDAQLHDLLAKHNEIQKRLDYINSQEAETKQENEKLLQEKQELEEILNESQRELDESRSYIAQLRQQVRKEKKERAMAAMQISEGIALERESLVKQLNLLREMNKKLLDARDEAELQRQGSNLQQELSQAMLNGELGFAVGQQNGAASGTEQPDDAVDGGQDLVARQQSLTGSRRGRAGAQLEKQGSVMSNYFSPVPDRESLDVVESDEDIECDEPVPVTNTSLSRTAQSAGYMNDLSLINDGSSTPLSSHDPKYAHDTSRPTHDLHQASSRLESDAAVASTSAGNEMFDEKRTVAKNTARAGPGFDIASQRGVPVGANSSVEPTEYDISEKELDSLSPERLFKVVFVGDSGVGKSSFIHQFCNRAFKATFSATIGVDFQVKNVKVDGHVIALQLWDTAGQERFRSITKQYFRKADGVLVMYDVTSEVSFKNVRNWMISVQDGTEESTVIAIAGNKIDLVDDEENRVVTTKDGSKLADEYGALFYECSAKTGASVPETIQGMASLLREREDQQMEKALNLTDDVQPKKKCCG